MRAGQTRKSYPLSIPSGLTNDAAIATMRKIAPQSTASRSDATSDRLASYASSGSCDAALSSRPSLSSTPRRVGRCLVRSASYQALGFGFYHVEVETQLHQGHFVMIRRMRADCQRKAVTIHDPHDFQAFSSLSQTYLSTAAFGRNERRIYKTFPFVNPALLTQRVGQVRQHVAQHGTATPPLEAAVHRLIIRIPLRQHVPLGAGRENPQHRFQNAAGRNRFAPRTARGNMFFGKVFPNPFPLIVAEL